MIIFESHSLLSVFSSLNIIPMCSVMKTFQNGLNNASVEQIISICKWVSSLSKKINVPIRYILTPLELEGDQNVVLKNLTNLCRKYFSGNYKPFKNVPIDKTTTVKIARFGLHEDL